MGFNRDQHISCTCIEEFKYTCNIVSGLVAVVTHLVSAEFYCRFLSQFLVSLHLSAHLGPKEVRNKDHQNSQWWPTCCQIPELLFTSIDYYLLILTLGSEQATVVPV